MPFKELHEAVEGKFFLNFLGAFSVNAEMKGNVH
jgi:hypothetical protein